MTIIRNSGPAAPGIYDPDFLSEDAGGLKTVTAQIAELSPPSGHVDDYRKEKEGVEKIPNLNSTAACF